MAADQRRRDQLNHGIAGHAAFTEIDNLAFSETLHSDEVTELNDIPFDRLGVTNEIGVAILKVNGGAESPCFAFSHHILGRERNGRRGNGWADRRLGTSRDTHSGYYLSVRV